VVGPDLGPGVLERPQAVDVIGMIVGDDHPADGLGSEPADRRDEPPPQRLGAQGVDDKHAGAGDHEAGVGIEALVVAGRHAEPAFHVVDAGGHPLRREGRRRRGHGV
jgi:hypothetical protein